VKHVLEVMVGLFNDRINRDNENRNKFLNKLLGKEDCSDEIEEFVIMEEKKIF